MVGVSILLFLDYRIHIPGPLLLIKRTAIEHWNSRGQGREEGLY